MLHDKFSFSLPVVITKQGKRFVAYTPALDISTCGKTEDEVKNRFVELAHLFLEEIAEAGTAEDVLGELGWQKERKQWFPPKVVSAPTVKVSVPAFA